MAPDRFGPAAPWRWLQQAAALLRAQPRVLGGATALLLSVALVPSLVQVALSGASPQFAQVLAVLLSLLLYPPAVAGFFRVVHALVQGAPVQPSALFAAYGDAPALRRMVIANLLFVSGSLLVVTTLAWAFGGEELLQFLRELSALQPGAKQLPALPPGVLPLVVALLLFGAALVSAQGLAFAELALGGRPPLAAIGAALRVTARNFGALLLFYVPVAVLGFLAFMLVALVAVLLGTLLAMLSPSLGPLLVLLLSLVLVLVMYALLFTFF